MSPVSCRTRGSPCSSRSTATPRRASASPRPRSLDALTHLYLPGSGGKQVPLSAIATFEERQAPLRIDRLGQFPATTISFNLAPGAALGDAVDAIVAAQKEIGMPRSIQTHF